MKLAHRPTVLIGTAITLLGATLAGCGGGGASPELSPSSSGNATYSGTVSGLGSIVVNGVRFSTTGAVVTSADDPTAVYADGFKLGTTVVVDGSVSGDDGQATRIEVEGGLRGTVSLDGNNLVVAGRVITITDSTIFDGEGTTFTLASIIAAVTNGETVYVEIHGTVTQDGAMVATRIEKKDATTLVYALKGYVVPGSLTSTTFSMQVKRGLNLLPTTLTVNYDASQILPQGRSLRDGVGVRVLTADNPTSNLTAINATKVLVKKDRGMPGSAAKVHGVVSAISGNTWTIDGVTVDVSQNPVLRGFSSLADITVGTELRIGGMYNGSVLTAKVIESEDFDHSDGRAVVKLFGVATGVNTTDRTFAVQGVTVRVPNVSPFAMPTEGSYVEVVATQINGVMTAVVIRGSGVVKPFEVFGVAACTNGVSDLQGTFALAMPIGTVSVNGSLATIRAEDGVNLAASVSPKTCLVQVKGTMTTLNNVKTLQASRIEIKARR